MNRGQGNRKTIPQDFQVGDEALPSVGRVSGGRRWGFETKQSKGGNIMAAKLPTGMVKRGDTYHASFRVNGRLAFDKLHGGRRVRLTR